MTLAKIAEIIAERAGRQFDIPFQKELKDLIVITRARVLTNSLSKNPAHKKYYTNSIILQLEAVSKDECDTLECECLLKTTTKVPKSLKVGGNLYDYVGSPGGQRPFGWTTFGAEQFMAASKYTGGRERYTQVNDYIYIFNDKTSEKIRVEDVFADPRVLANFSCSAEENIPCYSETSDFIADEAVTQIVIDTILSRFIRLAPEEEKIEIKTDKNV